MYSLFSSKQHACLWAAAAVILSCILCAGYSAQLPLFAKEAQEKNVEIASTPSQTVYAGDEEIRIRYSIKNIGECCLKDLQVTADVPDGYTASSGVFDLDLDCLEKGSSFIQVLSMKPESTESLRNELETSDEFAEIQTETLHAVEENDAESILFSTAEESRLDTGMQEEYFETMEDEYSEDFENLMDETSEEDSSELDLSLDLSEDASSLELLSGADEQENGLNQNSFWQIAGPAAVVLLVIVLCWVLYKSKHTRIMAVLLAAGLSPCLAVGRVQRVEASSKRETIETYFEVQVENRTIDIPVTVSYETVEENTENPDEEVWVEEEWFSETNLKSDGAEVETEITQKDGTASVEIEVSGIEEDCDVHAVLDGEDLGSMEQQKDGTYKISVKMDIEETGIVHLQINVNGEKQATAGLFTLAGQKNGTLFNDFSSFAKAVKKEYGSGFWVDTVNRLLQLSKKSQ